MIVGRAKLKTKNKEATMNANQTQLQLRVVPLRNLLTVVGLLFRSFIHALFTAVQFVTSLVLLLSDRRVYEYFTRKIDSSPPKDGEGKPRALASSATFSRHEGLKIAGLRLVQQQVNTL